MCALPAFGGRRQGGPGRKRKKGTSSPFCVSFDAMKERGKGWRTIERRRKGKQRDHHTYMPSTV
jgi:hypothetical protein